MYYSRSIDKHLLEWKHARSHKPLLLRGARQVGKSMAVRHFGESFKYYIELNFEKQPEMENLFESVTDVRELAVRIGRIFNKPIVAGETLLFLDEIQSCPKALHSLWFFKEDFPELHVVAAGSLLEFALQEMPSFGVGRIRSLFMYPMSFDEFLSAQGKTGWLEAKAAANSNTPLDTPLHNSLVEMYRTFLVVGGMPASVATWVETRDYMACAYELDDIQQTYYDDFVKYAKKVDTQLLRSTLQSVVMQIGRKFMYSKVEGDYSSDEVKKALALLSDAGIVKRVSHTAANGIPLGAEVNDKYRKFIYLDSGLLLRIMDIDLGGADELTRLILSGNKEDLVNKGALTEMVTGWELVKYGSPRSQCDLYYWENTDRGTTSEIDYVIARNLSVLPVEVKSGVSGKMKSLRLFLAKKHLPNAIRTSLENFSFLDYTDADDLSCSRHIDIVPLYAISSVRGRTIPDAGGVLRG